MGRPPCSSPGSPRRCVLLHAELGGRPKSLRRTRKQAAAISRQISAWAMMDKPAFRMIVAVFHDCAAIAFNPLISHQPRTVWLQALVDQLVRVRVVNAKPSHTRSPQPALRSGEAPRRAVCAVVQHLVTFRRRVLHQIVQWATSATVDLQHGTSRPSCTNDLSCFGPEFDLALVAELLEYMICFVALQLWGAQVVAKWRDCQPNPLLTDAKPAASTHTRAAAIRRPTLNQQENGAAEPSHSLVRSRVKVRDSGRQRSANRGHCTCLRAFAEESGD